MEAYILNKNSLKILSIVKLVDYEINLDEETNAKTVLNIAKTEGAEKGNFIVLNGLYKQLLFVIDEVNAEKGSDLLTITSLDISNIFNRKIIEKNKEEMITNSLEEFIANTIYNNFVNSDDPILNIGYIDLSWHTTTKTTVATNSDDGIYNFHTFLINCRQNKNIMTSFKFENNRLKIDIKNVEEFKVLIDTTLADVVDYSKIKEEAATSKVTVLIRENNTEYNLYLKNDRTTTTNKNDPNRINGEVEVISVETADMAETEALNVFKGNRYKHLVEFKLPNASNLMDLSKFDIGTGTIIKTDEDIYESYISGITIKDENFIYFKSGNLRNTLLDKLKKTAQTGGNKLDKTGGIIRGNLDVNGNLTVAGNKVCSYEVIEEI